ncbi:uncharacterized protein LOC134263172 isoform X3 [Saccostrea cucullata]|uniref:uncharacterized protein LOC134263172 isoform X3 n=1 Tax=Saccostrea cuccullata TaxID=36930 RepID=UPI002ED2F7F3
MMDFLNNFIFIFLLSGMERRVLSSNLDVEFCGVSKLTRVVVKKCPTDEEGWKTASKQKDCSSYQDKCSGNLTYHCVINPWQNLTVEVCAPPTRIRAGHCAEYNARGGKIQEFYRQNCKTCTQDYMSTEAYKYQECYLEVYMQKAIVLQEHVTRTNQEQKQESEQATNNGIVKINNKEIETLNKLKQQLIQQYGNQTEQDMIGTYSDQEIELRAMANINSGGSTTKWNILHLFAILLHFKTLF